MFHSLFFGLTNQNIASKMSPSEPPFHIQFILNMIPQAQFCLTSHSVPQWLMKFGDH
jgi:hypothetical protein